MDCIFCAIANGEIPTSCVYEDAHCKAFYDLNPQAPVHCLLIPKMHIESIDAVTEQNQAAVAHTIACVPKVAALLGLKNGYRLISNVGEDGCQSVKHLHFHILGGKKLPETMG